MPNRSTTACKRSRTSYSTESRGVRHPSACAEVPTKPDSQDSRTGQRRLFVSPPRPTTAPTTHSKSKFAQTYVRIYMLASVRCKEDQCVVAAEDACDFFSQGQKRITGYGFFGAHWVRTTPDASTG